MYPVFTQASKKSKELDKRGVIGEWVTSYLMFLAHCYMAETNKQKVASTSHRNCMVMVRTLQTKLCGLKMPV